MTPAAHRIATGCPGDRLVPPAGKENKPSTLGLAEHHQEQRGDEEIEEMGWNGP